MSGWVVACHGTIEADPSPATPPPQPCPALHPVPFDVSRREDLLVDRGENFTTAASVYCWVGFDVTCQTCGETFAYSGMNAIEVEA